MVTKDCRICCLHYLYQTRYSQSSRTSASEIKWSNFERVREDFLMTLWQPTNTWRRPSRKPEGLSTRECSDRKTRNGFKLKEGNCGLDMRKILSTVTVVRNWSRFSKAAVDAPAFKVLKVRMDGVFFEQPALVEGVLMAREIKLNDL